MTPSGAARHGSMAVAGRPCEVFLHIGVAKSGTTYLQQVLQANRTLLADARVLLPGERMADHFHAAIDVSGGTYHGHRYATASDAWPKLVAEAAAHDGTTLISHELFAPLARDRIASVVESLGPNVQVVVTARDLARQVPAMWQERVKNGSKQSYGDYLESIFDSAEGRKRQGGFWRQQHLVGITERWGDVVGPDRLTVVTLPRSGGDPTELWRRFARAVELPDLDYTLEVKRTNYSLGVVESELLRRLNFELAHLPWPQYSRSVKRRFAQGALSAREQSARLAVPDAYVAEIDRLSEEAVDHLRSFGCRVVGDLDDLRPARPVGAQKSPPNPDDVAETALLQLALTHLSSYLANPATKAPNPSSTSASDKDAGTRPRGSGQQGGSGRPPWSRAAQRIRGRAEQLWARRRGRGIAHGD